MHPVFKVYTLEHLHEQTGYSMEYLRMVRREQVEANSRFRYRVCHALDQPESELFYDAKEKANVQG